MSLFILRECVNSVLTAAFGGARPTVGLMPSSLLYGGEKVSIRLALIIQANICSHLDVYVSRKISHCLSFHPVAIESIALILCFCFFYFASFARRFLVQTL